MDIQTPNTLSATQKADQATLIFSTVVLMCNRVANLLAWEDGEQEYHQLNNDLRDLVMYEGVAPDVIVNDSKKQLQEVP